MDYVHGSDDELKEDLEAEARRCTYYSDVHW